MAVVQVEVSDYEITGIEVLEHKSLDVNAISGATLTNDTVLKAIEDALKQGVSQ